MSFDTGNLSLMLGGFFIFMSLFGICVIYFIIKSKSIENENIDKIIELGKWFFVSVAITLSASIINDGFRERDQDIKDIEVFDKYTSIVLEADGLQKRMLLCEYFSSVSPEGSIKKAWNDYRKIVSDHIDEDINNKKKIAEISNKEATGKASPVELDQKVALEEKSAILSQSLIPTPNQNNIKPRVYFHIVNEAQRAPAKMLADKLESFLDLVVPGVQRLDKGPLAPELRYFKNEEEQEANQIAAALSSLGLTVITKYVEGFESSVKIRPRHYELWISTNDLKNT